MKGGSSLTRLAISKLAYRNKLNYVTNKTKWLIAYTSEGDAEEREYGEG
jgi:hypothetical protein